MLPHNHTIDHLQAKEWARRLLANDSLVVLDTETTGVGGTDEIIQIGAIDRGGNVLLETLVQPTMRVPMQAIAVHGITNETLINAPAFPEVYAELVDLLIGKVMVAYNVEFDWRLLIQTILLYDLPFIEIADKQCAMKGYARFNGQRNGRRRGYRWHKLGSACQQEGIVVENAHSAIGDCLMTLALLKKMAE